MATASIIRNGVIDGTGECKCMQCGPTKEDVKHGMVGGEGQCVQSRRGWHFGSGRTWILLLACVCWLLLVLQSGKKYANIEDSFDIGQQCGCVNANAKRKANVKKGRQ